MSDYQPLNSLNEHVKTLKDNEKRRVGVINTNTSNLYAMFESNKDYFKYSLNLVRVSNQYAEAINLLLKHSGLSHGQFNEKVIEKLLFKNGIFKVNVYKNLILWIGIVLNCALTLYVIHKNGVNGLSALISILIYCMTTFISIIAFVTLLNSSFRFFKVKDPSKWD